MGWQEGRSCGKMTFRGRSETLPTCQRGACQELFGNCSSAELRGQRRSALAEPGERWWSSVTMNPEDAFITVKHVSVDPAGWALHLNWALRLGAHGT